jgi:peptide/nickel transport system permease protein
MRNLLTWTFGKSILYKTDVTKAMFWRIPYTLLLIGGSTIISIIIGVILGVMAVQKRGGIFDSGAVVTSLVFNALPSFWIGMVFLLIFYINLGWFPNAGAFPREWALKGFPTPVTITNSVSLDGLRLVLTLDSGQFIKLIGGYLRHLFLPMATLVIVTAGGWLIFTRASMLEVLGEDYVLTAKAKGLTERGVMFKHVLKNASLPIVTSIALSFGFVLGGALITEAVFTYPGLGQMTFQAIMYRDYSILMAFFYVMSICVIIANIIADLLYGVLDPRIRYG